MDFRKPFYALLGIGDVALETGRSLLGNLKDMNPDEVRQRVRSTADTSRTWMVKQYGAWAKRGERLAKEIGASPPAKRAAEQTKRARSQVKPAATSARKAASAQADAAKSAAKKAG